MQAPHLAGSGGDNLPLLEGGDDTWLLDLALVAVTEPAERAIAPRIAQPVGGDREQVAHARGELYDRVAVAAERDDTLRLGELLILIA